MSETIKEYLAKLSSAEPTPGGGSAAAYLSGIGIALALMSGNVSIKRKSFQQRSEEEKAKVHSIMGWLSKLQTEALRYEKQDQEAFEHYMSVYKSEDQKLKEEAAFICYNVPYLLLELNIRAINLIIALKPYVVKTVISDYKMALEILKANLRCCLINMDINIDNINDPEIKKDCENAHKLVTKMTRRATRAMEGI